MSVTSSSSTLPARKTVRGLWTGATPARLSSSAEVDLEAQVQIVHPTRSSTPPITTPVPVHTPQEQQFDAVDIFFGVSQSRPARATHESRHDSRGSNAINPPPYTPSATGEAPLPSYAQTCAIEREPATLAMYLFKYGFLFPLFWAAGALILVSSLEAPADWEPTKRAEERAQLVQLMRRTEVKWAKRCLIALGVLLVFAGIATGIAISVVRSHSS